MLNVKWLKWNVSHSLWYLHAWSPVGGPIWGGLGGVAFLEEVCHWGLVVIKLRDWHHLHIFSLHAPSAFQDVSSQLLLRPCLATGTDAHSSETTARSKPPFSQLPWSWCVITAAENQGTSWQQGAGCWYNRPERFICRTIAEDFGILDTRKAAERD